MIDDYIKLGIEKGYITISSDGKYITYTHVHKTYKYSDPEEHVRASYYVELIVKYQYPIDRIDLEIPVPRRTPNDHADIVIFQDDSKLKPFIVIECKKRRNNRIRI